MVRRDLLKLLPVAPLAAAQRRQALAFQTAARQSAGSVRQFLDRMTHTREEVSTFLDSKQPNNTFFDSELGYLRQDSILRDGVDGSRAIYSYRKGRERRLINYADRPCRINAYGDSFTHGSQVSDGETWTEYLAAHLGEPIRNYGVGGYGVYQSYRRMLREEATNAAAEYLILNIFGLDDNLRSVDSWRWLRLGASWRAEPGYLNRMNSNPWVHVRLDPQGTKLIELPNPFPTPESLYKLCDKEAVYEHFKEDLVVKLLVTSRGGQGMSADELEAMAKVYGVPAEVSTPASMVTTARGVHLQYGLRSTMLLMLKARTFAAEKKKKFMILLSYDSGRIVNACEGGARADRELIEFLRDNQFLFVDVMAKHVEDYGSFRLTPRAYANRYFNGHYKPVGNHFFAFAIKDAVVDWLDPKPIAYRRGVESSGGANLVDF